MLVWPQNYSDRNSGLPATVMSPAIWSVDEFPRRVSDNPLKDGPPRLSCRVSSVGASLFDRQHGSRSPISNKPLGPSGHVLHPQ